MLSKDSPHQKKLRVTESYMQGTLVKPGEKTDFLSAKTMFI